MPAAHAHWLKCDACVDCPTLAQAMQVEEEGAVDYTDEVVAAAMAAAAEAVAGGGMQPQPSAFQVGVCVCV